MTNTDNSQNSLKKKPKQERSRMLVASIYDATTRILERFGIDGTTTNRIAETTGISIGSLYQYFPNKDSILSRLIEQVEEEMRLWLMDELKKNENETFENAMKNITHAFVDRIMDKKKFLSPLFQEAPRLKQTKKLMEARRKRIQVFVEYSQPHLQGVSRDLLVKKYWIVTHALMGVIQSAVFEEEEFLTRAELKEQLTELTRSYLLN
jgi:AcrR family transcriptional regulator